MTAPKPSRAQSIAAAVWGELGRRRRTLNSEPGLQSVTIVVQLDRFSGEPRRVVFRTESSSAPGDPVLDDAGNS